MIAIFPDIRSLHNVGSMFRTADAVGIEKIYLTGLTPGPVDAFGRLEIKFTKVSLDAEKFIPYEKVESAVALIEKLHQEGFKIVAVEQSKKSIPYYQLKFSEAELEKVAIVMGPEVWGLSLEILDKADYVVEIPMFGQKESLNVSVAFGIIAFRLKLGI